jgi:L-lactate dehydrogenase complex protein LldG
MYDLFKAKAQEAGAEVHRFKTRDDALDFTLSFLRNEGVAEAPSFHALWADGPFLKGMREIIVARKFPGLGFEVTRETAADSLVGINDMDWAVADTGSLVADQTMVEQRLVSTLPAVHIAFVKTADILPDKTAVFSRITPQKCRYIAFITGPSRTADIERVLTIGVHGPKKLVIIFIDEPDGGPS